MFSFLPNQVKLKKLPRVATEKIQFTKMCEMIKLTEIRLFILIVNVKAGEYLR